MPAGWVVDGADVLSPPDEAALAARLAALDDSTTVQLVVVTVDTLGGEPAASFARRLAREWGVGRHGLNNGLLLLVSPADREVRVEVGTGLEWQVPDSAAYGAVALLLPYFRTGDYAGGLRVGVERLAGLAAGVPWDVEYGSLGALTARRDRAVGLIARVQGLFRTVSEQEAQLESDGGRTRLLLPPHWEGAADAPEDEEPVTLLTRVANTDPVILRVLGRE